MPKCNYHTHTNRCHHAQGEDEAYVQAAIEAGYDVLGFADHSPWPYRSGFVSDMRMTVAGLPQYLASIRDLARRYQSQIEILAGLECEYFPDYIPWLRNMMDEAPLDYIILGNHFDTSDETGKSFGWVVDPQGIRRYVIMTVKGMETGLYTYLAHPDLFLLRREVFTQECADASRELCRTARAMGMPLEYNLQGRVNHQIFPDTLGYPCDAFWAIAAEEGCQAIIGVDAHQPASLIQADYDEVRQHLQSMGLAVVDRLPIQPKA